jgi:hypothetical protein
MDDKISRRSLLQRTAALGTFSAFGAVSCGKRESAALVCTDTTGLSPADLSVRTVLAYVDVSTTPGKTCSTCQQFVPSPVPRSCGTCKILKGPINPIGNCKSYLARVD